MATKLPKPEVKVIRSMDDLPKLPAGENYLFSPAYTIDQARGVCIRQGATAGYWLKNRVYFVGATACVQIKPLPTAKVPTAKKAGTA